MLGKDLDKGVGLDDAVSNTGEFVDAEEVFPIRGDQGPDTLTNEFSPLVLSQLPGIFSDDVSWRLVMYPCSLMMIGSCFVDVLVLLFLVVDIVFLAPNRGAAVRCCGDLCPADLQVHLVR